ncbi:glycine--tRNA ligase subunit beta [Roseobacter denitrificans]|uniref:Glycine--tRNA ligase beta subunit n=1 Tax=Roseobacter denitrificans (strain ATCC 33942 / OCh 114) TaxID=375451 RepID=Q168N8_ROSDO|nr:glycine--tRNA ligase subunit beta [Roseobacter denitrificans]ABG31555.1 glycyl-tRNA synthetase, beta subunit [Roseobacter denitrificans OCh 114]AVL54551.1 glycine--tRNA ligase subunit beta [Roseobacter denitrificans]SFF90007.1 glycyl-tRNA synthetase beta chain [Roseobacter denitrificans OCh 114]
MPDLLIELFCEEIPARMQRRAAQDLQKLVTDGLVEAGLTYASAAAFSTPRRLTLTLEGVLAASPTTVEERKGPKADAPDKAIEGFLRGAGVAREALETRDTPKGPVLFAKITKEGRPAAQIVAEVLEKTIRNFPWPKSMRWGAGTLRWVRPLHSILCILSDEAGTQVVPLSVDHITAGDHTQGHRFMAPDRFTVTGFDDYAAKLKRAFVVLDPAERADMIWHDATNQAFANGLEVVEDAALLAEVAGLVEWPVVLMGRIGDDFLDLPPEVLQTSMKEHQKFFSVRNPKTGRIERFVTVANRDTADNGATILAGNEKVLSARLADAKFFWDNDLRVAKAGMGDWLKALENVTFHNKLGTQAERIARVAALARELAPMVGADSDEAEEAARFAKADLSSEMVYEFPELQGLMGRYYLKAAGKSDAIAAAAEEHYAPLGPSDAVPTASVSVAVALADKLDQFTGMWAANELPTGSKDPYALRRAALSTIRLILENRLKLPLKNLLEISFSDRYEIAKLEVKRSVERVAHRYPTEKAELKKILEEELLKISSTVDTRKNGLSEFFHDRLKVYLRDQGIRHDVIDACIAMPGNDDLTLLVKRAKALSDVVGTEDGENLIQGFKRANNILTQAQEADGVEYSYGADAKFAETDEERALFKALDTAEAIITPAMKSEDFATAMSAMATLRAPIDAFFEAVQVNSDNPTVRRNRLNLLNRITQICLSVADLTRIEG